MMKSTLVLLLAIACAGCVAGRASEPYALSDGSSAITISCDDGWAQCYAKAEQTCGKAGFEELDRAVSGSLGTAGRMEPRVFTGHGRDNEVYSEGVRQEVDGGNITIRCKRP